MLYTLLKKIFLRNRIYGSFWILIVYYYLIYDVVSVQFYILPFYIIKIIYYPLGEKVFLLIKPQRSLFSDYLSALSGQQIFHSKYSASVIFPWRSLCCTSAQSLRKSFKIVELNHMATGLSGGQSSLSS